MDQLPKLKPTVGGGLPGLPKRKVTLPVEDIPSDYWIYELEQVDARNGFTGKALVYKNGIIFFARNDQSTGDDAIYITLITDQGFMVRTFQVLDTTGSVMHGYCMTVSDDAIYIGSINDVIKISMTGEIQWVKSFTELSSVGSVSITPSGDILLGGYDGSSGRFLLAAPDTGIHSVSRQITHATGFENIQQSKTLSDGSFIFAGGFDNGTYNAVYIARTTSAGTMTWSASLAKSINHDYPTDLKVDLDDNIYLMVDADNGSYDMAVIAKFTSSGSLVWKTQITDGSESVLAKKIAISDNGDVYALVSVSSQTNVVKLSSSGSLVWDKRITTDSTPTPEGIVLLDSNKLAIAFSGLSVPPPNPAILCISTDSSFVADYGDYIISSGTLTVGTAVVTIGSPGMAASSNSTTTGTPTANFRTSILNERIAIT